MGGMFGSPELPCFSDRAIVMTCSGIRIIVAPALAVIALLWPSSTVRADEAPQPPAAEPAQVSEWIEQLDSDLYVVRERAMRQLEDAGPAAMEQLATAANGENLEVATRCVRLLLQLSEAEDLDISTAALEAIAALENRPVERRAAEAILHGLRARKALAAIVELGGVEKDQYQHDGEMVVSHLHLGEGWKGGDEGLRHVRQLEFLRQLSIHGTPVTDKGLDHLQGMQHLVRLELYGTQATRAGVEELAKTMPRVDIDFRGGAMLGVGGIPHPKGAQVTFIQGQSAAAFAGLLPGDIITRFNGQAFQGFEGLTAFIARCQPDEKATLEILREGQTLTKEVRFGKWK